MESDPNVLPVTVADGLDWRRNRISVLIDEIAVTTRALLASGVDPGHKDEKREALAIVKRITEVAHRPSDEKELQRG